MNITAVADSAHVEVAFSPGKWQHYTLTWSDMESEYHVSINSTPDAAETKFIAIRGASKQSCQIRVNGTVVTTDAGPSQAVCRA